VPRAGNAAAVDPAVGERRVGVATAVVEREELAAALEERDLRPLGDEALALPFLEVVGLGDRDQIGGRHGGAELTPDRLHHQLRFRLGELSRRSFGVLRGSPLWI